MKKALKANKRIISLLLVAVMLIGMIPFTAFALNHEDVTLATLSDIHYYAKSLKGNKSEAYLTAAKGSSTAFDLTADVTDAALASAKKKLAGNDHAYLLITGDLTAQGEYASHVELSQKLLNFEAETSIDVIVTNGNHDINNYKAVTYENDVKEETRKTTPEDFLALYKDLGYDLAYHQFTPSSGKQGMCSYSVRLDEGYRLIIMDTNCYSADATVKGDDEHETRGVMSKELWQWVLAEMKDAKECGEEIIGINHASVVEQLGGLEENIFQAFVLEDWEYYAGELADNGMHYVFTGHQHSTNISSYVSDNGETIYDCQTPPSASSVCGMYITDFTSNSGKISADYHYYDVDCEANVVLDGVVQEKPFKYKAINTAFSNNDLSQYVVNAVNVNILPIFREIEKAGGIVEYASSLGYNLEDIIKGYFSGLSVAGIDVFTVKNIMGLIEDLSDQIMTIYIKNPAYLNEFIKGVVEKIENFQVSDVPCTKYIDTLGFGDKDKPGTLGNTVMTVLYSMFSGNEDISDDAFMQDVINNFENDTATTKRLVSTIIDVVLDDVLFNEIFAKLKLNIDTLFPEGQIGHVIGGLLDCILNTVLGGDTSFTNVINFVFSLGVLPYDDVRGVLNSYMEEYFTESQYQTIGIEIAEVIKSICCDSNPKPQGDKNVTYSYTGKVDVEVNQKNYRAPSLIALTFGDDSSSDYNISWYTKKTVTGTDIEIVPYSSNPKFTGVPTVNQHITASTALTERTYPGIDFGVIGLMTVKKELNRHIVKLTNLESGTKYCYRVGDAKRGWWSEAGVIETADQSDDVTFFHMSDCQSGSEIQYKTWANVLNKAFKMYPESKFILNTGDIVDQGNNLNQWAWALNTPSSILGSKAMMPTSGNHENFGQYADKTNFVLPNVPEQDEKSGTYYSFDYNNIHVAVLNTNDLNEDESLSDAQVEWLKEDMASSGAKWKFVSLHKAMYSNGSHYDDEDVIQIRNELSKLMYDLDIDMVFQGHDHVYLRTDVMANNAVVSTKTETIEHDGKQYKAKLSPDGSIYVISACSGVKYYLTKDVKLTDELFPRAESIVDCKLPVFSAVQIENDMLYFDAYTVDGDNAQRIDNFAISKKTSDENNDTPETTTDNQTRPDETTTIATSNTSSDDNNFDGVQTGQKVLIGAMIVLPLGILGAFISTKKKKKVN